MKPLTLLALSLIALSLDECKFPNFNPFEPRPKPFVELTSFAVSPLVVRGGDQFSASASARSNCSPLYVGVMYDTLSYASHSDSALSVTYTFTAILGQTSVFFSAGCSGQSALQQVEIQVLPAQ